MSPENQFRCMKKNLPPCFGAPNKNSGFFGVTLKKHWEKTTPRIPRQTPCQPKHQGPWYALDMASSRWSPGRKISKQRCPIPCCLKGKMCWKIYTVVVIHHVGHALCSCIWDAFHLSMCTQIVHIFPFVRSFIYAFVNLYYQVKIIRLFSNSPNSHLPKTVILHIELCPSTWPFFPRLSIHWRP